ncbi:MAG: putative O-glycosylation ligase, exosortase A system-associated [Desulfocapsaceae bacterium]|nr:putative O-glycosylation ligase, exosortase A system-associated [Desulfosporosinus sp.]MDR3629536.1 putative O-glycosylation ligase, exosortase A system-associated [Desulfocapsaceae bacterium]
MRDLLVFLALLGGIPWYFLNPYYGVLAFFVVSILNPHRYTWGAAYSFPFAQYIAFATLLGLLFGRGLRNPLPKERETAILLALWLMFLVSSLFSLNSDLSMNELSRVSKILLMTFVTMWVCCSQERLRYLFWVIALSMGLIGIKGGLFGILTGGGHTVFGPPDSFISDNNDVGLAFNIALPIIYHLATFEKTLRMRKIMMAIFFLTVLATILTFSRGSAIALAVLLLLISLVSKNKVRNILTLCILGFFLSFFLTEKWTERMNTINTSDMKEDSSFMGRVNAWHNAWNIAVDRPFTGGGLAITQSQRIFERYAPDPNNFHAAHSIYFQMLGENGFVGLMIFLVLLCSLLASLNRVRRKFAEHPEHQWLSHYAVAIQLSLIGFMINGLTLGRAYFDLAYLVIAMGIMTKTLARAVEREQDSFS